MYQFYPDEIARNALEINFRRYFAIKIESSRGRGLGGALARGKGGKRTDLSEIIPGLLWVSAYPTISNKFESEQPEALVVSCNEWKEIRGLSKQVQKAGAHHFLVAMEDVSGAIDSIEHVIDAILSMKKQYDAGKPSFVHCSQGVGRSVMLAYTFVSYLYLCGDVAIKAALDKDAPLDPTSPDFIDTLTQCAFKLIAEVRGCSQFDRKVAISREALKILQLRLIDPRAHSTKRTPEFEFFAELVQFPSFKQLITASDCTQAFLQRLIKQEMKGWDEVLEASIKAVPDESGHPATLMSFRNKALLQSFQADIQRLREKHPNIVLGAELERERKARIQAEEYLTRQNAMRAEATAEECEEESSTQFGRSM